MYYLKCLHSDFLSMLYIGRAYLCRRALGRTIIAALACTAILHGLYDYVVIAMPAPALPVAALLILVIWVWRLFLIRDLHTLPPGPCP